MKIAVTRVEGKEGDDSRRCHAYGHECYRVSPLRSRPQEEAIAAFINAVHDGKFDCIFFTSAMPATLIAPSLRQWPRIVAIGPQTARILERSGIPAEVLPSFYSRDFVPYLGAWIRGRVIGLPRADVPNTPLIAAIMEAGGVPEEYRCYALVATGIALETAAADAVLFTSAMSFREAVWTRTPGQLVIAIGDVTAAAMTALGVAPDVTGDGSLEGALRALNEHIGGV